MATIITGTRRPELKVTVVALVAIALAAGLAVAVVSTSTYDTWAGVILGPLLFALSLPILSRKEATQGDSRLFWLFVIALGLKLLGACARYYFAFDVYGGQADAASYHRYGIDIAANLRDGFFSTELGSSTGTNFIRLLTGGVYAVTGPTLLGGFLVFSWLGYWGIFLFYRAFALAVPEGRRLSYARLVFLFPSLLYWPSSIGKEAWMTFGLGVAAFGFARLVRGDVGRGLLVAGVGLWVTAIVRPHVAGMIALGMTAGYALKKGRNLREAGPFVRFAWIVPLILVAVVLVVKTDEFLKSSGIETDGGVTSVLRQTSDRTGGGASNFVPSIVESPSHAPLAAVTVLFRPFIFEAHNLQALAAALETTFLIGLSIVRLSSIKAALKSMRSNSYAAFAVIYTGLFIVAFSSIANFGLLSRERVQVLPMYLVLLAFSPRPSARET